MGRYIVTLIHPDAVIGREVEIGSDGWGCCESGAELGEVCMSSLRELYIIGAGGFGREVAWLVERINETGMFWNLKGFIDNSVAVQKTMVDGYPVLGKCDDLPKLGKIWVVCAVGSAMARKKVIRQVEQYENVMFATLVDPKAEIGRTCKISAGSIICANSVLTADVCIGGHVLVNLDCTIGHDTSIEDFVTIYPGVNISGNCSVGACSELGTGTHIIQGKKIGEKSIVGAGAVVVKDIPGCCTAVGNPARVIKCHEIR